MLTDVVCVWVAAAVAVAVAVVVGVVVPMHSGPVFFQFKHLLKRR